MWFMKYIICSEVRRALFCYKLKNYTIYFVFRLLVVTFLLVIISENKKSSILNSRKLFVIRLLNKLIKKLTAKTKFKQFLTFFRRYTWPGIYYMYKDTLNTLIYCVRYNLLIADVDG